MSEQTAPETIEITDDNREDLAQPIASLLSAHPTDAPVFELDTSGIKTKGQLIQLRKSDLLKIPGIGPVRAQQIEASVRANGHQLGTQLTFPIENIFDTYKIKNLVVPPMELGETNTAHFIPLTQNVKAFKNLLTNNANEAKEALQQIWIESVKDGFTTGSLNPETEQKIEHALQDSSHQLRLKQREGSQRSISVGDKYDQLMEQGQIIFQQNVLQALRSEASSGIIASPKPSGKNRTLILEEDDAYRALYNSWFHDAAKPLLEKSTWKGINRVRLMSLPRSPIQLRDIFDTGIQEVEKEFKKSLAIGVSENIIGLHKG